MSFWDAAAPHTAVADQYYHSCRMPTPANSSGKEQGVIFYPPLLVGKNRVIGEEQRATLKEVPAAGSIPS